jgi:hypothetical protein
MAGCYVILCTLLHQLITTGEVDVFSYCQYVREQDATLMLDEEQYAFIYLTLSLALPMIPPSLYSSTQQYQHQYHQMQQYVDGTSDDDHGMMMTNIYVPMDQPPALPAVSVWADDCNKVNIER